MFGVSLLFFYATFNRWMYDSSGTVDQALRGSAVCWPYFQSCTKLYFLHALPYSYSQMAFYMALFVVLTCVAYCMWRGKWTLAHALLTVCFVWKVFVMFVLNYNISGNYDYYHVFLTFILLFLPFKEYFLKICFVALYFLSVTTKFHQTWILGSYFTTLELGTPIFPDAIAPLITNSVIFMQVVGCWFLLSRSPLRQRLALAYFATFHLYSIILVQYLYPTISLTALLVLFGPLYRYTPPPISKKALWGAGFIAAMFLFQLPGHLIPGDQKLTLEGNKFGMYMFEANHQCAATIHVYTNANGKPVHTTADALALGTPCPGGSCTVSVKTYPDGNLNVREERWESAVSMNRCDPYYYWTRVKNRFCDTANLVRVEMQFDHSIDGGPFYRIVDEPDICGLVYHPFAHNAWIRLPPEAQIVGYPYVNTIRY